MSEAVTPPVVDGQPPIETPPAPEPSGLPSDNTQQDFSGFDLTDANKALFKDGKLNGRFSNMDDVLLKLKEAEDFKAATISEQTKANNGVQQQQEASTAQATVVQEILPTFLENGMVLTPEMEAKITADIKDPTQKELAIYKFRDKAREIADRANKAYDAVGGKEKYGQMQVWAGENLSKEHQAVFTADVNGSPEASIIAVEWLQDKYDKAIEEGTVVPRLTGQPANVGLRPYADRRELYKDKDYVESPAGRRDTAAQKMYKARLRMTPDAVIYGQR